MIRPCIRAHTVLALIKTDFVNMEEGGNRARVSLGGPFQPSEPFASSVLRRLNSRGMLDTLAPQASRYYERVRAYQPHQSMPLRCLWESALFVCWFSSQRLGTNGQSAVWMKSYVAWGVEGGEWVAHFMLQWYLVARSHGKATSSSTQKARESQNKTKACLAFG